MLKLLIPCPRCGNKLSQERDDYGVNVDNCYACGYEGYGSTEGITVSEKTPYNNSEARKNNRISENVNSEAYLKSDSGCEMATQLLGCQSLCLECPFPECLYKIRK